MNATVDELNPVSSSKRKKEKSKDERELEKRTVNEVFWTKDEKLEK